MRASSRGNGWRRKCFHAPSIARERRPPLDLGEERFESPEYVTRCKHQYKDDKKVWQTYPTATCPNCQFEICPRCAPSHPCKCTNKDCPEPIAARLMCVGC